MWKFQNIKIFKPAEAWIRTPPNFDGLGNYKDSITEALKDLESINETGMTL